jgi:hypothetical protein
MSRLSWLLLALTVPSWGATLDQSFISTTHNLAANINECCKSIAQTYTAGLTGALSGVQIDVTAYVLSPVYPLDVEILSVSGGFPTATVLGETVLASNASPLSSLVTFPQFIQQTAGTQYAISVSYPSAPFTLGLGGQGIGSWAGDPNNLYAGGQAFALSGSSWFALDPSADLNFQTFVSTPEPNTLVPMFIIGLIVLFWRRRRDPRLQLR